MRLIFLGTPDVAAGDRQQHHTGFENANMCRGRGTRARLSRAGYNWRAIATAKYSTRLDFGWFPQFISKR